MHLKINNPTFVSQQWQECSMSCDLIMNNRFEFDGR